MLNIHSPAQQSNRAIEASRPRFGTSGNAWVELQRANNPNNWEEVGSWESQERTLGQCLRELFAALLGRNDNHQNVKSSEEGRIPYNRSSFSISV